ncbi:MAG: hypothetical protein R3B45_00370 [Bdellovibrionota bacterium]
MKENIECVRFKYLVINSLGEVVFETFASYQHFVFARPTRCVQATVVSTAFATDKRDATATFTAF